MSQLRIKTSTISYFKRFHLPKMRPRIWKAKGIKMICTKCGNFKPEKQVYRMRGKLCFRRRVKCPGCTKKNIQALLRKRVLARFTSKQKAYIKKLLGNLCVRCSGNFRIQIDHIKPVSRGGSNAIHNAQLLCHWCNFDKGTKEIDYRSKYVKSLILKDLK